MLVFFQRKQVGAVILDQFIGQFAITVRQGIAQALRLIPDASSTANGGQFRPNISADRVHLCALSKSVGIHQTKLGCWMPFERRTQVKFEPSRLIFRGSHTDHVNIAQQKLSFGIACVRSWLQIFDRLRKLPIGKSIPRGLHIGMGGQGETAQKKKRSHWISLWFSVFFAGVAGAQDLPKPLTDAAFTQVDAAQARLGQLLFYDPLLSGNRNISCATCHNPAFGSGDGVALGFGEGGIGLGPDRVQGDAIVRQSRNAPGLWNLGASGVRVLFHDGRVEQQVDGFKTPAGARLPEGLSSVLAAQMLFPLIARTEMAGDPNENDVALAASDNAVKAWSIIAARVADNAQYRTMFETAYGVTDVEISHIVNALADFVDVEFRAYNTPFDHYLKGEKGALTPQQESGLRLFYGDAGCSACHSGSLLSDQAFHSIGTPQFGPGLTRRFDPVARDLGRMAVTDHPSDAYRFRTPFLRNVTKTAPYGHNGAFNTLDAIIRHHSDPGRALAQWRPADVTLLPYDGPLDDFALMEDALTKTSLIQSISIAKMPMSEDDVAALVAFLEALSAPDDEKRLGRPKRVPSELPID